MTKEEKKIINKLINQTSTRLYFDIVQGGTGAFFRHNDNRFDKGYILIDMNKIFKVIKIS
jgi:hypothetical protein